MALSGTRLGDAIKAAVDAVVTPDPANVDRTAMFRAIGTAIIAEIIGHAQVTSTVAVASVTGVLAGGAASGPGTGTATGTVT